MCENVWKFLVLFLFSFMFFSFFHRNVCKFISNLIFFYFFRTTFHYHNYNIILFVCDVWYIEWISIFDFIMNGWGCDGGRGIEWMGRWMPVRLLYADGSSSSKAGNTFQHSTSSIHSRFEVVMWCDVMLLSMRLDRAWWVKSVSCNWEGM